MEPAMGLSTSPSLSNRTHQCTFLAELLVASHAWTASSMQTIDRCYSNLGHKARVRVVGFAFLSLRVSADS